MRIVSLKHESLWIKYIKFSDKYFNVVYKINRLLIDLEKYNYDKDEDLWELALQIKMSGQV